MCLGVPGKIISVTEAPEGAPTGRTGVVDFQGSEVEVSLAMTPEAKCGDWVLIHAGFALTVMDEAEARQTWEYLTEAQAEVGDLPAEFRE